MNPAASAYMFPEVSGVERSAPESPNPNIDRSVDDCSGAGAGAAGMAGGIGLRATLGGGAAGSIRTSRPPISETISAMAVAGTATRRRASRRSFMADPLGELLTPWVEAPTGFSQFSTKAAPAPGASAAIVAAQSSYLTILVTRPAPTVRPPSRMANRRPSSMATGWISFTEMSVLSPGMTISVPSGSVTTPVTSVVRK